MSGLRQDGMRVAERKKCILVHSGVYFHYDDPESHRYNIEDIAHALALQTRYTGHCKRHYSIAQHSVLVSYRVPPEDALAGLLHDASEAYLGDINTHLKALLPQYKVLEARVEAAIAKQYGTPVELPASVKEADARMLMTEKRDLLDPREPDVGWPDCEPYDHVQIAKLTPEEAEAQFLYRFQELTRMNENEYVSAKGKVYKASTPVNDGMCTDCAFQTKAACPPSKKVKGASCTSGCRSDGRSIIWVRQEKKE